MCRTQGCKRLQEMSMTADLGSLLVMAVRVVVLSSQGLAQAPVRFANLLLHSVQAAISHFHLLTCQLLQTNTPTLQCLCIRKPHTFAFICKGSTSCQRCFDSAVSVEDMRRSCHRAGSCWRRQCTHLELWHQHADCLLSVPPGLHIA